jgi:Rrf2 family protein
LQIDSEICNLQSAITMRVSAKAQYACVAMLELAASQGEPQPVHVKAIADHHGISQRFLVQILLQLKMAGLVESIRGAAGGYQLALAPEAISLGDIINAIDHTPAANSALNALTRSAAVKTVGAVLEELQVKKQQLLREVTLADLLQRSEHTSSATYQI